MDIIIKRYLDNCLNEMEYINRNEKEVDKAILLEELQITYKNKGLKGLNEYYEQFLVEMEIVREFKKRYKK